MSNKQVSQKPNDNRLLTGAFLVMVGGVLLIDRIIPWLPDWVVSWQTLLIGIGLFIGIKSNFENKGWIIPVLIGGIFLLGDFFSWIDLREFTLPIIFIVVGLLIIIKPGRRRDSISQSPDNGQNTSGIETVNNSDFSADNADYINSSSIFGGTQKIIVSKNFKGGNVDCFMGGAEIDLSQADMQQPAALNTSMVFGGLKLVVPAHWNIQNEVNAIFGGIEDKRNIKIMTESNKTLVLRGSAIFGGIEIKSY
jgi:predicted membrane protein